MKNFAIKWKRKRKLWNFFSQNGSGSGSAIKIYRFQNAGYKTCSPFVSSSVFLLKTPLSLSLSLSPSLPVPFDSVLRCLNSLEKTENFPLRQNFPQWRRWLLLLLLKKVGDDNEECTRRETTSTHAHSKWAMMLAANSKKRGDHGLIDWEISP